MKTRAVPILMAVSLLCSMPAAARGTQRPTLRIYLPREIEVDGDSLRLGDITIVRSAGPELAGRASAVTMGRAPFAEETLVIDRRTVLSRLAAAGIPGAEAQLSGAEKIMVKRRECVVSADRILLEAEKCLARHRPGPEGAGWRLTHRPKNMVLPGRSGQVHLRAELLKDAPKHYVTVGLSAVREGKTLATVKLTYRLMYPHQQAVATRDIAAGQMITPDNARLQGSLMAFPQDDGFRPPFGKIATSALKSGTVIRPGLLRPASPVAVVEKGQTVVIKVVGAGFVISGLGQALEPGRADQIIRVRNLDSKRIIEAEVMFDGTVSPVIRR